MTLSGFPAVATIPVQWGDQDLFGHVNNTIYFRWFESARVEYWYQSGLHELLNPEDRGPILASVTCDYKRQIRFPDDVLIGARTLKIGTSSVTLEHSVFSSTTNAIAATGQSVIVMFDYGKQHPIPIDDEMKRVFDAFERKQTP